MVFSDVLHQYNGPSQYNRTIAESSVEKNNPNPLVLFWTRDDTCIMLELNNINTQTKSYKGILKDITRIKIS